jgi:hypothetical protein
VRDEVEVAAPHPGDGRAELRLEVELADGVTHEGLGRQRDAAVVQVCPVGDDVV